jgi:hypothetical protein
VVRPNASGPFPVVLVGPGSGASQNAVARAEAGRVATRGFVGVAFEFPCTNAPGKSTTDPQVALDVYNQPGDVSFVLTRLLAKSTTAGNELTGLFDPSRVGFVGTSSGAVTGLLFFNTCCTDPRIRGMVIIKGFPLPTTPGLPLTGEYDWSRAIGLYLWSGCFDQVTPFDRAYDTFGHARPPKLFVQDPTGNHDTPAVFPTGTYDAFLDRYVAGNGSPGPLQVLIAAAADPHFAYDLGVPGINSRVALPSCALQPSATGVPQPAVTAPAFTG